MRRTFFALADAALVAMAVMSGPTLAAPIATERIAEVSQPDDVGYETNTSFGFSIAGQDAAIGTAPNRADYGTTIAYRAPRFVEPG